MRVAVPRCWLHPTAIHTKLFHFLPNIACTSISPASPRSNAVPHLSRNTHAPEGRSCRQNPYARLFRAGAERLAEFCCSSYTRLLALGFPPIPTRPKKKTVNNRHAGVGNMDVQTMGTINDARETQHTNVFPMTVDTGTAATNALVNTA